MKDIKTKKMWLIVMASVVYLGKEIGMYKYYVLQRAAWKFS